MKYIFFLCSIIGVFHNNENTETDNWFVQKTEAISYAEKNDGQILMVFAGSDWCKPCKKFKKEILIDESFMAFSNEKLAILYLDFPAKKKNKLTKKATDHNESLAELFNQSGTFPKVILLNKSLNKIKEIEYNGQSTEDFISGLKSAQ